jgi:phosphatidylglycerol:prolipoprotein diacylglycerol transferase
MQPYVGSWPATTLSWLVAAALGGGAMVCAARRDELTPRQIAMLLLGCTAALLVGAKALYLVEVLTPWEDGRLSSQQVRLPGGMLAVLVLTPWLARRDGVSSWRTADLIVPALGLLILCTRLGCFLQGCCFGRPSSLPWALPFPHGSDAHVWQMQHGMTAANAVQSLPVQPLQLYFAIAGALIFVASVEYEPRKRFDGEVGLYFTIAYFWSTWLLELLRAQPHPVTQQFSLLVAVAATAIAVYVEARRRLAISDVGGSCT